MKLLNQENILKSQVDTIKQFKVLTYLKQQFNLDGVSLYLLDRFTIKLIDKNNDVGYFKYNSKTKSVDFYENIKKKEMERWRDEKMRINYIKMGDYLLPDLIIKEQNEKQINKYGRLKLNYMKEYDKTFYTILLMKNELINYLVSVSIEAENRLNILMESYKKSDEKLSEKNKELNQIEWIRLSNNYKNCAEEIILKELIYTQNV